MSEQEMMHDHPAEEIESEEYEVEALAVEVSTQPIELYKVLKIANAVSGGGEAKFAIAEGYVAVNGELEQRKRCKLYDGDVVEFNQEFYVVIYQPNSDDSFESTGSQFQELDDTQMSEPVNSAFEEQDLQPANSAKDSASKGNKRNTSGKKPAKKSKSGDKQASSKKKSSKKSKANEKKEPIVRDQNTGRGGISF